MSGLLAVFDRRPGSTSADAVNAALASIADLGRDGTSTRTDGPVVLACAQQRGLTPEDAFEAQPVSAAEGRLVAVFDGRIDNRPELRRLFGLGADEMAVTPDSRLFLMAWERWGVAAPSRLVGDFAAIVWDSTARELIAVRDPIGGRVLHWHESPDRVIVASAPRAIHACGVSREVDLVKVADSLILNYCDAARTFYEGIQRLPMGHRLRVGDRSAHVERYHDVTAVEPLILTRDHDYVDAAFELLETATAAVLRTTTDPSLMLSSGLDSTLVATVAQPFVEARGGRLHTYTSVPTAEWESAPDVSFVGDESLGVDEFVAMHPGLEHTYVRADERGLLDHLDPFIAASDVPPRNAMNLYWIHEIHALTRRRGANVVLDGGGGNLTLGWNGHGLLHELATSLRLPSLWAETGLGGRRAARQVADQLLRAHAPRGEAALTALRRRRRQGSDWRSYSALAPDSPLVEVAMERAEQLGHDPAFRRPATRQEVRDRMLGNAFSERGDLLQGMRALHGTESRDPFLDRRVVEFAFAVPNAQYRRNGQSRWLQRRMLEGRAPAEILDDSRGRQAADARLRLRRSRDALRRDVADFAGDDDLASLLDLPRLRTLLDDDAWWDSRTDPDGASLDILAMSRAIATGRFVQMARSPARSRIPQVVAEAELAKVELRRQGAAGAER